MKIASEGLELIMPYEQAPSLRNDGTGSPWEGKVWGIYAGVFNWFVSRDPYLGSKAST